MIMMATTTTKTRGDSNDNNDRNNNHKDNDNDNNDNEYVVGAFLARGGETMMHWRKGERRDGGIIIFMQQPTIATTVIDL